jgi:hypothetical protein
MRILSKARAALFLLPVALNACSGRDAMDRDGIRRIELPYGATVCRVELIGGDDDIVEGLDSIVRRVQLSLNAGDGSGPLGRLNTSDSIRTDDDLLLGALRTAYMGYRLTERYFDPVVEEGGAVTGRLNGSLEMVSSGAQPQDRRSTSRGSRPTLAMLHPTPWFPPPGAPPVSTALRKERRDLRLDLSTITPGVLVDELVNWLTRRGVRSCHVQVDAVSLAIGTKPDGTAWTFAWDGVEQPHAVDPRSSAIVLLRRQGGAIRMAGQPLPVIDPRTGLTVDHALHTVMVMHPHAAQASAMAFGLLVMGPDQAARLAAPRNDYLVHLTFGTEARTWASRNWPGEAMAKGTLPDPRSSDASASSDVPQRTGSPVPSAVEEATTLGPAGGTDMDRKLRLKAIREGKLSKAELERLMELERKQRAIDEQEQRPEADAPPTKK